MKKRTEMPRYELLRGEMQVLVFGRVQEIAVSPAAHQHATVLGRVKDKPSGRAKTRVLDPSCAR